MISDAGETIEGVARQHCEYLWGRDAGRPGGLGDLSEHPCHGRRRAHGEPVGSRPDPGRVYNLADDLPAPPQDVIAFAAELLGLPVPPEVPFEAAPFGVTGLETAFSALYTHLVEPGLVSLETLLERMSAGPARAYGLDAPRIAVGAPANLVLLDTQASWQVTEDGFKSRSKNSWLIGEKLRGRVRATIAAGRLVHES